MGQALEACPRGAGHGWGLVLWPRVCDVTPGQEPLVFGLWVWRVSIWLKGHYLLSP